MNEIQGSSSTTIMIPLIRVLISLASYLTAIRGALLYFVLKYSNAESSVLTATASIPCASKAISQTLIRKTRSESSQDDTDSPPTKTIEYHDPALFLYDVVNGKLACQHVPLDKWIEATIMTMDHKKATHLDLEIPYGGGLYQFHHCIKQINPPVSDVDTIMEEVH